MVEFDVLEAVAKGVVPADDVAPYAVAEGSEDVNDICGDSGVINTESDKPKFSLFGKAKVYGF